FLPAVMLAGRDACRSSFQADPKPAGARSPRSSLVIIQGGTMRWKHALRARGIRAADAVMMLGAALAAGTVRPAGALPNDPIDPPPLPGDSAEPFTPPANGFTWSVPSRFGTYRNGIVDYHWNETANSDH